MRSEGASEFYLGHLLGLVGDRERLADFEIRIEDRCYPALRIGPERRVVILHRENVIAERHGDPIFGALELRLKREEILIRLAIGIGLRHREQSAERAAN